MLLQFKSNKTNVWSPSSSLIVRSSTNKASLCLRIYFVTPINMIVDLAASSWTPFKQFPRITTNTPASHPSAIIWGNIIVCSQMICIQCLMVVVAGRPKGVLHVARALWSYNRSLKWPLTANKLSYRVRILFDCPRRSRRSICAKPVNRSQIGRDSRIEYKNHRDHNITTEMIGSCVEYQPQCDNQFIRRLIGQLYQ